MKNIIALRGGPNTGKSKTIREVYKQLLGSYLYDGRVSASIEVNLKPKETSGVVTIDGVRVGIESMGDNARILAKNLHTFELKGCTIIICACRPGKAFDAVLNELKRSSYEVDSLPKVQKGSSKSERDAANMKVAQDIVTKIEGLL